MKKRSRILFSLGIVVLITVGLLAESCFGFEFGGKKNDFPAKPITMIVPYGPGGSSDVVARLLSKVALKYFKKPLIIENKPGAASQIGLNALGDSAPDGYTVGISNNGMVLQTLTSTPKYNYPEDLQAIAQVGYVPYILIVKYDAPWKNLDEFTKYAKENPNKIKYGHTGIGNTTQITAALYAKLAGIQIEQIPFDGGGPLLTALLGGHIQAAISNPLELTEQLKAKRVRVLAVADSKRMKDPLYKGVPTFKEKGYNDVVILWQGIAAPKGLPADVKKALADGFKKCISDPEVKNALVGMGLVVQYLGPDEFQQKWREEKAYFKGVLDDTGIMEMIKSQKK
jgi:tripartite-type tricarboxylate transporter receptor subunit TctC